MDDLISRQDAIMAVKTGALSGATIYGRTDEGSTALYETVRAIKALPSAQPIQNNTSNALKSLDFIDRQAAIDAARDWYEGLICGSFKGLEKRLRALPSAQQERTRGRWIPVTNGRGGYECDQCHNYAPSYQDGVEWLSDFCPNCGADMRGEDDE